MLLKVRRRKIKSIEALNKDIIGCRDCPRLVDWRETVALRKRRQYMDWEYWGKPVPGFGDHKAQLLIVGLAPAAHGANRTGRMFTGDQSGNWLYGTLYKFGFANQLESLHRNDRMQLQNCYISATVRCAPPMNKPTKDEFANCRPYLVKEFQLLPNIRVIVGLGKIAFDCIIDISREFGWNNLKRRPEFKHGNRVAISPEMHLIGSYHPSQQNTFTRKLTRSMFHSIFRKAKQLLS